MGILLRLVGGAVMVALEACFSEAEDPVCPAPCGRETVRPSAPPGDRDGDRVPDDRDLCPDVPHIGSPDGCPPRCEQDGDADGVNDCDDSCPEIAGVREAFGCTEASYPLQHDFYRLIPARQSVHMLNTSRPCVHAFAGAAGTSLFWTDGQTLFVQRSSSGNRTAIYSSDSGGLDLCQLHHPIAENGQQMTVLWHRGTPGGRSELFSQRFSEAGGAVGNPYLIDSFPTPNLGPLGDGKIAALSITDAYASVAWVNRDKVSLQTFLADGTASERMLINERSVTIERNFNPDVSADASGDFAVVWQEGAADQGPIQRAIVNTATGEIDRRRLSASGLLPVVALTQGFLVYAYASEGIQFVAEEKGADPRDELMSSRLSAADPSAIHPALTLDARGRMIAAWATPRADAPAATVHLHPLSTWRLSSFPSSPMPLIVDQAASAPWVSLAASDRGAALLYPGGGEGEWQLSEWRWEGSEAPRLDPELMVQPASLRFRLGQRFVALKLCNRGIRSLDAQLTLSTGFYLALNDGDHDPTRSEQVAGGVCLVRTVVSDGSASVGEVTLQTSDPQHTTLSLPLQVER